MKNQMKNQNPDRDYVSAFLNQTFSYGGEEHTLSYIIEDLSKMGTPAMVDAYIAGLMLLKFQPKPKSETKAPQPDPLGELIAKWGNDYTTSTIMRDGKPYLRVVFNRKENPYKIGPFYVELFDLE